MMKNVLYMGHTPEMEHEFGKLLLDEDKGKYKFLYPVPGCTKDDVELTFEENVLYISANGRIGKNLANVVLDSRADVDQLKANVKDGLLEIELKLDNGFRKIAIE
jgi:HSP20 family molecular chaperone IbpA